MLRDGTPGTEQTKAKRDKKEKRKNEEKSQEKILRNIKRSLGKLSNSRETLNTGKFEKKKKEKKWENFLKTRLESEGSGRRWTLIIGVSKK